MLSIISAFLYLYLYCLHLEFFIDPIVILFLTRRNSLGKSCDVMHLRAGTVCFVFTVTVQLNGLINGTLFFFPLPVEFEVNIVVLLHDDHLITENFPLKLCRM